MGDFSLPRLGGNTEATTSLLGEEEGGEGYSMQGYAHTFVQDVYNAFRSIHPVAHLNLVCRGGPSRCEMATNDARIDHLNLLHYCTDRCTVSKITPQL
jgi:hypothetical protein